MLKFLARNTSNEAAIRNLEDSRAKKEAQMGVLKAVKKALGQANRNQPAAYTSMPRKLSTMETKAGGKILEVMKQMESNMFAKQALEDILKKVESNIPEIVAEEVLESLKEKVELKLKRTITSKTQGGKKLKVL